MSAPDDASLDVTADLSTRQDESTSEQSRNPVESFGERAIPTVRFRVLRFLAKGGLGRVSVAADEELGREVALKEIRDDHADDPMARERFLREAEVTGRLEHPGIVPVYGLGAGADGRPYYAMRLIQGRDLAVHIREWHAMGRPGLGLRRLLQSFVAACNAIAFAHNKGVVHRDLKPANIMLGDFGETLVVDWGLAKRCGAQSSKSEVDDASADSAFPDATQAGAAVGTPAFMPPEQAAGDWNRVGPAADIYSLGATLFVLLTGKPPVQGRINDVLAKVKSGQIPTPRHAAPWVARPLEAVCRKAMARQPEDRYASTLDLAADVERWLADEPVTAYRESALERFSRWRRRHRPIVTATLALLLTLTAALAVGFLIVREERDQKEQARAAESRRREQARSALDEMSSEVVDQWLASQKRLTPEQKAYLERSLAAYERFAEETGGDPVVRFGAAQALVRVAELQALLMRNDEAVRNGKEAVERFAQLAREFPNDSKYPIQSVNALLAVAQADANRGARADAATTCEQAGRVLTTLIAQFPDQPPLMNRAAAVKMRLGVLLASQSRPDEASVHYSQAAEIWERLTVLQPDAKIHRVNLANVLNNLAGMHRERGQLRLAQATYARVLNVLQTPDDPGEHSDYLDARAAAAAALGGLLADTGDLKQAEQHLAAALPIAARLAAQYPNLPDYSKRLAMIHMTRGLVYRRTGRDSDAAQAYAYSFALYRRLVEEFPDTPAYVEDLARLHLNFGGLRVLQRQVRDADAEYCNAIELARRLVRLLPDATEPRLLLTSTLANRASLLHQLIRGREALEHYDEAAAIVRRLGTEAPSVVEYQSTLFRVLVNRAVSRQWLKQSAAAEADFVEAVAGYANLIDKYPELNTERRELANARLAYSQFARSEGNMPKALALLLQAVDPLIALLTANPNDSDARQSAIKVNFNIAEIGQKLNDHGPVAPAALRYAAASDDKARGSFTAARFLAQCVPLAQRDVRLPEFTRVMLADLYADRAIAVLQLAFDNGFQERARLKDDAFSSLRGRAAFKSMIQ